MSRKRKSNCQSNNNSQNQSDKYVMAYSKSAYEADEKRFNEMADKGQVDWSSFQRLMVRDLAMNTRIIDDGYIGDVRLEDALLALKHPKQGWRILLNVSDALMRCSPHYYRLNSLFGNMAMFCWWLDLYDVKENANVDTIKKMYGNLAAKLEGMNLKHEFSKIMRIVPYQDIYCGLIFENQSDFYIQQVSYKVCRLYETQDGLYNFIINLASINPKKLSAYPDYVQQAYIDFVDATKNGLSVSNWYEPPADKQICIKLNTQWQYPYPFLIGLVKDILDLDIYKKLKLQSARTDNYKAIMVKVPIDENTVDKPLLTPETLGIFAEINRESMSDDIGLIYNLGSDGEAISFKDSTNNRNNVADAVNSLYDASGESKELYNGSASGTALTYSVENDSGFVYSLYRQFERWVNRYIKLRKYNKSTYKFYFYLLDITVFNRDNVTKRYKEAVSLGATVIDKWLASLDMTPSRMLGSYVVHNDIFDFANNFVPLSSSYNSNDRNDRGRPTNKKNGEALDVAGEITQDHESNSKR